MCEADREEEEVFMGPEARLRACCGGNAVGVNVEDEGAEGGMAELPARRPRFADNKQRNGMMLDK